MANKKVSQLTSKPSVLTTDLFPIADPSTGQLYKTTISDLGTAIGSGVSSVNGLVGAVVLDTDDIQELVSPTNKWFTDTRARAALSASSPLTYNSGTGAFGIQVANGSQNGYLSSTDWTTFNNKLSTATAASTYVPYTGANANVDLGLNYSLTAASIIKSGGTSSQFLKADGSIDTNTYLTTSSAASTYLPLTGGTLTGALQVNGYLSAQVGGAFYGDVVLSGTNPKLYFTDTDNNPDYFISNTDGTFTIYDVTNSTSRLTISTLNTTLNTNLRIEGDVLIKQDSVFGGVSGYTGIGSDSAGIYLKLGTASSHAYLVLSGLTSYRNFTLPDATGTFALTSDLSSYLPLSGGTLTGALSGTSATFSSGLISQGAFTGFQYNSAGAYPAYNTYFGAIGTNFSNSNSELDIWNTVGGGFVFRKQTAASTQTALLTIASSGAATFSSSVQTTNLFVGTTGTATSLNSIQSPYGILSGLIEANVAGNAYYNSGWKYYGNGPTGVFNIDTGGNFGFYTAGSGVGGNNITLGNAKVTFTNAGNVGIGTTSPLSPLHLVGSTTGAVQLYIHNVNGATNSSAELVFGTWGGAIPTGSSNPGPSAKIVALNTFASDARTDLAFHTYASTGTSAERMRITSSGNVGIGTSVISQNFSGYTHLDIGNATTGGILLFSNASGTNYGYVNGEAGGVNMRATVGNLTFNTGASERMRITSGGHLLIGQTTASGNTIGMFFRPGIQSGITSLNTTTLELQRLGSTGNVVEFYNQTVGPVGSISVTTVMTSYNVTSDYRLKEDLKPINGLDIVNKIKVYDYKWKADNSRMDGVLAHELQEVLPYAVTGIKDGEQMQSVDYSKIVPVMVQAIKDLKAELDTLKNK